MDPHIKKGPSLNVFTQIGRFSDCLKLKDWKNYAKTKKLNGAKHEVCKIGSTDICSFPVSGVKLNKILYIIPSETSKKNLQTKFRIRCR